jgi:hypothetical protein
MSEETFNDLIEVGGKEYRVVKTGRAQAQQVVRMTKWISKHGMRAIKEMRRDIPSSSMEDMSGVEFLGAFVEALDEDALIDLFMALIGCDKEDAEVYFDISILIDVAILVYNHQPALQKLIDRFLSTSNSEPSSPATFTISEPLTDTPTEESSEKSSDTE